MAVDDATWALIRKAFEARDVPVATLSEMYGVAVSTIYRRARAGGWTRAEREAKPSVTARLAKDADALKRGRRRGGLAGVRSGSEGGRGVRRMSAERRSELVHRLYGAIDAKLGRLEQRLRAADEASPADSERETREIAHMIRSFERVSAVAADLEAGGGKRRKGKDGTGGDERGGGQSRADAERLRGEIAERLERLFANGAVEGGARKPER